MYYFRFILLLLLCNLSLVGYSQLPNFNFNVTVTDEVCTNSGKLEMAVSNIALGSDISYKLYRAPDFEIHIAETETAFFSTLQAGSYRVVAEQSNGEFSNSMQEDVVIEYFIEQLDFQLTDSASTDCDLTATLSVIVLSGNPTFFEIISGPVIRPMQTSNEFNGLPSGMYVVRVFDTCGDALSKGYTFVVGNNDLRIGTPVLPEIYTDCNTITITNSITPNGNKPILYPLLINYTVFTPSGDVSQNITQTINSGPPNILEMAQSVNLFGNELFTVEIEVTDNCNTVFFKEFKIDPRPKLAVQEQLAECGEVFFSVTVKNFLPPFLLNFTNPDGFLPVLYNSDYPGPFNIGLQTFGSSNNPIPYGDYMLSVQDACGRTADVSFILKDKQVEPVISSSNNGCNSNFGNLKILIPDDREITTITMIEAPGTYPGVLPVNMISFVNDQGFFIHTNLPVGDYTFLIVDNCGDTYTVKVKVPAFVFGSLVATTRPDCNPTTGAVRLSTSNGSLVTVKITAAPLSFIHEIPYDLSTSITSSGLVYVSNLPAGQYTFEAIDDCGFNLTAMVEIFGYTRNSTGFQLNRKCGSFDITLNDQDQTITGKRFWLQKFFPEISAWGNPYTGAPFVEGSIPTSVTAKELFNDQTLLNIFLIGDFRIIKEFDTFENGNPNGRCTDLYIEFSIAPELIILGAYNLSCNSFTIPNDVVIDVEGVAPFNFKMISPFVLDNGTNNAFLDLAAGNYNFQVTDNCGNIKNIPVDIGNLLPLARAYAPESMLVCRTDGVQFGVFPIVNQTPQILGNQNPNSYNVTYHFSQLEADNNENPLPDGYTNVSNPQIIYARVEHKTISLCYATTSFTIFAGITPELAPVEPVYICEGLSKTLVGDPGFLNYEWSTGERTQSITVTQAGTYTLTVRNVYLDFSCNASKDYVVAISNKATIQIVNTSDWTSNQNSIVVLVSGLGNYLYSLDNVNFQTSNIFTDLLAGNYTVYVKDANGCGTDKAVFSLLNYPKYFTPNGDGYNDRWHIQFSNNEANLNVEIFDRYGNFITKLKGQDSGWDGTYNGKPLPATDYWFVVSRHDGTIHKAHFSLKR